MFPEVPILASHWGKRQLPVGHQPMPSEASKKEAGSECANCGSGGTVLSDFKHFLLKTLHETILYYLHCFVDEGSFATLTASQHWNLNVCVIQFFSARVNLDSPEENWGHFC